MVNTRSGGGDDVPSHPKTPKSPKSPLTRRSPKAPSMKSSTSSVSTVARKKKESDFAMKKDKKILEKKIRQIYEDLDLMKLSVTEAEKKASDAKEEVKTRIEDNEEVTESDHQEVVKLIDEASDLKFRFDRAFIIKNSEAKDLMDEIELLESEHEVTLAKIDEDDDLSQHLSDEDFELDDDEVRMEDFLSAKGESSPSPSSSLIVPEATSPLTSSGTALDLIAQALTKLSANQGPSTSDKFIARQAAGKDLPFFNGRPEEYPMFIADYERTTTSCQFSNSENLQRLRKCLKGDAAKAVQCLMITPDNVPEVMETLKVRFGQPEHIVDSLIKKVRATPAIKEEKLETVIEFGTAVVNLVSTIKALKMEDHLNNPVLLKELKDKMPSSYKMQWLDWLEMDPTRKKNMLDFTTWIKRKLHQASELAPPSSYSEGQKENKGQRRRPFAANAVQEPERNDKQNPNKVCYICKSSSHWTNQCESMTKGSPDERILLAAEKNLCFNCFRNDHKTSTCQSKRVCGKDGCQMKHHSLLHGSRPLREIRQVKEKPNEVAQVHHLKATTLRYVQVVVSGPKGDEVAIALQDDGSNVFAMDESIRREIGATGQNIPLCMKTIGGDDNHPDSQSVSLKIRGGMAGSQTFQASNVRTVKDLSLENVTLDAEALKKKYPYLRSIPLQSFFNEKPKLLIGSSHFRLIQHLRVVEGGPGEPIAIKSRLGWSVLMPDRNGLIQESNRVITHHNCQEAVDEDLHQLVKKSFLTEDFGVKIICEQPRSKEDTRAIKIMEKTTVRGDDGIRYKTGLLWKNEDVILPESKSNALQRLKCQERKMDKDPGFAKAYCAKMDEYLEKGYIKKIDPSIANDSKPRTWYLPHFGVTNPNKPGKLRLVFDAAAKSHGTSLNDVLCQGPDLNNSLVSVLMRFRQYKYAFAGDIKHMFHRVFIQKEDRHSQCFLWRGMNRDEEPATYEMQVMIFGATSSPSSAQFAKNLNATENKSEFPEAATAIITRFYVDDYLDSKPTVEEACQLINQVTQINAKAGLEVCNWVANSPKILKSIPIELRAKELTNICFKDSDLPEGRVLGMWWSPTDDNFCFRLNFHRVPIEIAEGKQTPTKRQVLKLVMSVFDPLGFLGHLIIKAKILMQDIWRSEIGWDDLLPDHLNDKWTIFLGELQLITDVSIPRCYSTLIPNCDSLELHLFGDASLKAFSAIAFLRVRNGPSVEVRFIMSRTRVAPLKPLSIPRLELQAALMCARLAKKIKEELDFNFDQTVYHSDSSIFLKWLRSDARRFNVFVAHRLGEILETTDVSEWRWIPSALNVADDATRDEEFCDLSPSSRWFNGPDFLREEETAWPEEKVQENSEEDDEEMKRVNLTTIEETDKPLINFSKFSSYRKVTRIMAWVLRYIKNLNERYDMNHAKIGHVVLRRGPVKEMMNRVTPLKIDEIKDAEMMLFRMAQTSSFPKEMEFLYGGKSVPKNSPIFRLSPYLDQSGTLRMRGRMQLAEIIPEETKNPIILDRKNPVTKLLVQQQHQDLKHQGRTTIASELRQRFWIVGMTAAVKEACSRCQVCRIQRAVPGMPEMGNLPEVRSESNIRPFTNTGLDYFGPLEVVVGRRREKRWVALFTCLSIRAVHLEIAHSLTTDSAISAIRRFSARRGVPTYIYSDNGTNFHGANVELRKALDELDQSEMESKSSTMRIQWVFNPPAAPHMGGVWERLVGSVKRVLNGMMNLEAYTDETLATFLCEAEAILNKRPLTEMSMDPDDPMPLTPNHFLIGWSAGRQDKEQPNLDAVGLFDFKGDTLKKKNWRAAQALADEFWRRWVKDYLPTLTKRDKWHQPCKPLKTNDIVLVVDDQAKRNACEKGIVLQVFPGKDGKVRVAEVKTQRGTYRRPVAKLVVLDLNME